LATGTAPVRLTVTAPVEELLVVSGEPEVMEVTPALVKVTLPPSDTAPPPDIPVPAVTVIDEFVSMAFVTPPVAIPMVPVVVMGPPVKPEPVATDVTPVLFKVEPLQPKPVPAVNSDEPGDVGVQAPLLYSSTCPDVGPVADTGVPSIAATVDAPRVPVTSPATAMPEAGVVPAAVSCPWALTVKAGICDDEP